MPYDERRDIDNGDVAPEAPMADDAMPPPTPPPPGRVRKGGGGAVPERIGRKNTIKNLNIAHLKRCFRT